MMNQLTLPGFDLTVEIEAESSDSKRLKTTVVIDSDGEREEVGLQRGELGRKQLGATGRRSSRNLAELVVVGSRKDSSEQIYLEKSKSGQFNSPSPQVCLRITSKEDVCV